MSVLVGKKAIDFTAKAVMKGGSFCDDFNLQEQLLGKYGVLFFYPLDFTFVCPTEIIAFNNRISAFTERDAVVIGVSVDSHFSHAAWRNSSVKDGGIGEIEYPLVSDLKKSISRDYQVLIDDSVALRATFIIDPDFNVRSAAVNDLNIGRNVDEILRILDALRHSAEYGEVCPAGWNKGKEAMRATHEGVSDYLASNKDEL
ncbi:ahpC/TSA family protein [Neorickettsia helminthoeca str. Oregon]|uniref:AhpC/TSA family protein n=1 Tax=Neorickettsia helminthoeca str. Oregon TaxID=1286528 RepID=X5H475_9RICK|nr:peroxiredoxin [Neorickettsia helminthoeca]AHX11478.1 ahpC/TSA family protein [Neorickettsia helminthoeca str. Oregon]